MLARSPDAAMKVHRAGDWLKVGRIDARSIPAQVIEIESVRDRADDQLVGKAMRSDNGTRLVGMGSCARPEVAVAARPDGPDPEPTRFRLIDLYPKPINRNLLGLPSSIDITVPTKPAGMHRAEVIASGWFGAVRN